MDLLGRVSSAAGSADSLSLWNGSGSACECSGESHCVGWGWKLKGKGYQLNLAGSVRVMIEEREIFLSIYFVVIVMVLSVGLVWMETKGRSAPSHGSYEHSSELRHRPMPRSCRHHRYPERGRNQFRHTLLTQCHDITCLIPILSYRISTPPAGSLRVILELKLQYTRRFRFIPQLSTTFIPLSSSYTETSYFESPNIQETRRIDQ